MDLRLTKDNTRYRLVFRNDESPDKKTTYNGVSEDNVMPLVVVLLNHGHSAVLISREKGI